MIPIRFLNSSKESCSRSGVSAERRKRLVRKLAALCRDAATPSFSSAAAATGMTGRRLACGLGALLSFAGLALVASAQQPMLEETAPRDVRIELPPAPADDLQRHFRVGMWVGIRLRASFRMSGNFNVSGNQPGLPGGGVDHIYDDGYVRVDQTGNALDRTSYWGYNNASQYTAQTLTFHSAKSFTATGSAESDDSPYIGFDLAYGGMLRHWGPTQIGWEFGFGLLPISITDDQPVPAVINRTVHSFNTGGILLPTAPYNGGDSGVGPSIFDEAIAQPDDTELAGTIAGSRTLDVMLYVVRLGPMLHWELAPRWACSLSAGPAAGFVTGDLKFDETVSAGSGSGSNSGKIGGSDFIFGGYVSAVVMYHAVENGDFYLGAQYMPLGRSEISGGGRQARLDMSGGIYFSAGINWPF